MTVSSLAMTRSLLNSGSTHTDTPPLLAPLENSPAGSVGEHDVAFLVRLLDESHARLFLPVTHGLLEHGPLSTWNTRFTPSAAHDRTSLCVCVYLLSTGLRSGRVTYQ